MNDQSFSVGNEKKSRKRKEKIENYYKEKLKPTNKTKNK